jgi:hypothetical protein
MVETIAPVVHGGRNRSYRTTVALHTLGATLSAAVLGALLGAAGALTGAPWGRGGLIALAVVAMLYAVREAFRLPLPLLDRRRQVPEWWRTFYSHTTAAFLYGVGLGAGFFTYLSYGTYVAVSAAAFISGRPLVGALLSAPFGLARGLSVIAGRDGADGEVVDRLERTAKGSSVRLANAGVLAALGLAAILSLG